MANKLKQIFRFSNWMRIITFIALSALLLSYLSPFIHPKSAWLLPFFGLSYPIILIGTFLLLIYWTIKRSKWALVVLGVILLGSTYHMRLVTFFPKDEINPESKQTLKILTNNVRIFDLYDSNPDQKYATRDSIFNYAIQSNADVVCFQEFYRKDAPTNFLTSKVFFKNFGAVDAHERLIYKPTGHQHFGIAMFSKYPIIAKGEVIFETEDSGNFNFSIFTDIVKDKDTFRVYNVHLQSVKMGETEQITEFSEKVQKWIDKLRVAYPKRAEQADKIVEHIQTSPYPVIVCGDFNDTPISYVYNQFSAELTDAFLECGTGIGSTYVGKVPAGRIDYIFHSPELSASNFVVQQSPFSDHRAIECIISKQ